MTEKKQASGPGSRMIRVVLLVSAVQPYNFSCSKKLGGPNGRLPGDDIHFGFPMINIVT